jgi:hypothetical protein
MVEEEGARPHSVVMTSEARMTKQGVRDLNHYGPRPKPTTEPKVAEVPEAAAPPPPPKAEVAPPVA